eukprot:4219843-Prymnesium_polylepis.1
MWARPCLTSVHRAHLQVLNHSSLVADGTFASCMNFMGWFRDTWPFAHRHAYPHRIYWTHRRRQGPLSTRPKRNRRRSQGAEYHRGSCRDARTRKNTRRCLARVPTRNEGRWFDLIAPKPTVTSTREFSPAGCIQRSHRLLSEWPLCVSRWSNKDDVADVWLHRYDMGIWVA